MKVIAALPVLIAFLVSALPAHAWTWPVSGPVLRPFSFGDDPFAAGQHRGLDVGAPPGTTVVAPAGGVVTFAGAIPRSGRAVTIATEAGYSVTLVHLGSYAVGRGATVAEGAPVGTIGPSGEPEHAQGYVHLGVRVTADEHGYVDPAALLPVASSPGNSAGGSDGHGEGEKPAEASEPRGAGEHVGPSGGGAAPGSPGEGSHEERQQQQQQQQQQPAEAEHPPPPANEARAEAGMGDGDAGLLESNPDPTIGRERLPERAAVSLPASATGLGESRSSAESPNGNGDARSRHPGADRARSTASTAAGERSPAGSPAPEPPRAPVGRRHEELGAGVGTAVAGSALGLLALAAAATALRRPGRGPRIQGVPARLPARKSVGTTTSEHLAAEPGDALGAELDAWLAGVLGPKSACVIPRTRSGGSREAVRPRGRGPAGGVPTRPTPARARAERYARAG